MYLSPERVEKVAQATFSSFCKGLAECLRSHTALPRWAGPMQKGKESMAVRPPDQRDDSFRYIGFSTV